MNSNEAVVNAALDAIGYKRHISSMFDGTPAARAALNVYSQTRQTLLAQTKPDWSRHDAVLVLLKSAPTNGYVDTNWDPATNPPFPWLFEYANPADNLLPLQIKPRDYVTLPVWRPRYITFREALDNTGSSVILTNQPNAIMTYISDVINPAKWHDPFTTMMIQALAQQLSSLVGAPQKEPERANPS